jgi:putative transposase
MTAELPRKQRLSRLDVIFVDAPIYFVTACTVERRKSLAHPAVHKALIEFANDGPAHGAWLGRYVLMPDHLHAFVALDDEKITLGKWMKSLKNTLSKTLRARKISSPHWQKTFFDHVLRTSESYTEKWEYVHANPARAGLVQRAEDWAVSM